VATAIFRTFTNDGFLIAADGRQQELGGTIIIETKQKIFSFGGSRSLSYAFTGRVGLGPDDSRETTFDFITQVREAAQIISTRRCSTLPTYADRLARHVQRVLEDRCRNRPIKFADAPSADPNEAGSTIAEVLIDGYYSGSPSRVSVRFYRQDGQFVSPQIVPEDVVVGGVWLYGSKMIAKLLGAKDKRFYNERSLRPPDTAIPHFSPEMHRAVIHARAYIEGCSSPEGLALERKICSSIGGKIHMASITANEGFKWVPGFEPATQS
jgi:hypothetical protein